MVVNIDKFIEESELTGAGGFAVSDVSRDVELLQAISGVTTPTNGTLPATNIATQDHADGAETGQKFEFKVPDDYDSGPLNLNVTYAMGAAEAGPNNVIYVQTAAEIAKASDGSIDTTTYPPTSFQHNTPVNTDIVRVPFMVLSQGTFTPGDSITFLIKRRGDVGASDLHTDTWQVITYDLSYLAQVAARRISYAPENFSDTDEPFPPVGNIGNIATIDFETAVDQEQQIQFQVPDHWDEASDLHLRLTYAMSTGGGGTVRFETEGSATKLSTGGTTSIPVVVYDLAASADILVHRSVAIRALPAADYSPGDTIALKVARRGTSGSDTHAGDFRMIDASIETGTGPSAAVSQVQEIYLPHRDFRIITTPGVSGAQESADLGGDFELWSLMSSTVAAGRINAEWQGRLATNQSEIVTIKVPLKGTGTAQYELKVYTEDTGQAYTGGLQSAPGTRQVVEISGGALSAQPGTEKRYFIVVEATLNASDTLRVGTPFVRQE